MHRVVHLAPSWDRGVSYESAYRAIIAGRQSERRNPFNRCYYSILLLQLRNGSRISEAVRAYRAFLASGRTVVEIPVSGRRGKGAVRKMVVPQEIERDPNTVCLELLSVDERRLTMRVKTFCRRKLKINTHTLRLSYITHLLENGVNPAVVARIARYAKIVSMLPEVSDTVVEEVLRRVG